jgi:hypothetical protein
MDHLIPPAVMYGLARDILRSEMGNRIEQRRAVGRDSPEGARLTKVIATLVQLGQDLDETARQIIAAGRAAVEERLTPPQMPRVDAEGLRARYPGLLSDDAQVRLGAGWSEILEEALEAVKSRPVIVWLAREHCAGLRMMIGPVGEWRAAEFDLAAEVTERAWAKSLQACEACGRQSAAGPWSRYRTRCADHAEVR